MCSDRARGGGGGVVTCHFLPYLPLFAVLAVGGETQYRENDIGKKRRRVACVRQSLARCSTYCSQVRKWMDG